jgi:pimeloyl-ACP methyl ester carboxylesterase
MCPPEQLRAVDPDGVVLPATGHNVHVENPLTLWPIMDRLWVATTGTLGR